MGAGFLLVLLPLLGSCATLQEIAALSGVRFSMDRVSSPTLAGVPLAGIRDGSEMNAIQLARVASALASGRMPMTFTLHLGAENPADNPTAQLMAMDWSLFLNDREAVAGALDRRFRLEPGGTTDIPVEIRFDLMDFYEGSARDLLDVALSLAGREGPSSSLRLQAIPTIETALGPVRYPRPIQIIGRDF